MHGRGRIDYPFHDKKLKNNPLSLRLLFFALLIYIFFSFHQLFLSDFDLLCG